MDADFELEIDPPDADAYDPSLDEVLELQPGEPFDTDLPPPPAADEPGPERGPRGRANPIGPSDHAITIALVGSVAILGVLKVLFFFGTSMVATLLASVLFVAANGLFIMGGAAWFWPYRYNSGSSRDS
jgi:hypothetical protein